MIPSVMKPLSIKRTTPNVITISWQDGHVSEIKVETLRDACPCAGCTGEQVLLREYRPSAPDKTMPGRYELHSIIPVGMYAVQIQWGDGHGTGIYTWEHLRSLCNTMQTLILVDEVDTFLGYASREECHAGTGKHHRAVAALLLNGKGQILLQKRKSTLWDGYWDIAGATHTLHTSAGDETYESAGERLMRDEWDLSLNLKKILAFNYFERFNEHCENEYCVLLAGKTDVPVKYQDRFAYDMRWIDPRYCLTEMQRRPSSFTPWGLLSMTLLQEHHQDILDGGKI